MNSKYKTQSGFAKRTASTNTIKAMENGTNPNDFFLPVLKNFRHFNQCKGNAT